MAKALLTASKALISFLKHALDNRLDPERVARVGNILVSTDQHSIGSLFVLTSDYLHETQNPDGGWIDIEETTWCLAFLKKIPNTCEKVKLGEQWLIQQIVSANGWGRNNRDNPRIPYTSWVAFLVPEVVEMKILQWLEFACNEELRITPLLSYKIALPLMAFRKNNYSPGNLDLIKNLVTNLIICQNEDGGFAPWKGHPCGSDPWCTGIAALGLLSYANDVPRKVFERILDWITSNQLPNGFWSYHYIDEGSAIAYWALRELLIFLRE